MPAVQEMTKKQPILESPSSTTQRNQPTSTACHGSSGRKLWRCAVLLASFILLLITPYYYSGLLPAFFMPSLKKGHAFETPLSTPHEGEPSFSTILYAASYSGTVTTLNLTHAGGIKKSAWALEPISSTTECAGSPSWLTVDSADSILYCTDEGLTTDNRGSISSFKIDEDGLVTHSSTISTVSGPVSAIVFGAKNKGLAVAHYGGSALTTWNTSDLSAVQSFNFTLVKPGPDPSRQEAPHPHAVVTDPTGKFLLVPDLGADLIRLYYIDQHTLVLTEHEPLVVDPGSGPRHLTFVVKGHRTFMYVVTELANTIVGFEVGYEGEFMAFKQIWTSGSHGLDQPVPKGSFASEIAVSPDSRYLIISSRGEGSVQMPNLNQKTRTSILSDPLINFAIDGETGHLELVEVVPAGGKFPRHFSINKAGNLVAAALQRDGRVSIMQRDVKSGVLGDLVAHVDLEGEITAVVFQE